MRADMIALPQVAFNLALDALGPDALAIAARFSTPPITAFRRIAVDAGAGLVICDASGTLTLRKRIAGFSLPRFGAACPLWPLFSALVQPMVPIEQVVETPNADRFLIRAFCQPRYPEGFAGPELREAVMLILPVPNSPAPIGPVRAIGATCRICPRKDCAARREPAILS
jgi:predicted transcriptional regulator